MPKPRGRSHTTLTETATEVVRVLRTLPNIKMIAPGEITSPRRARSGTRFLTIVYTTAGCELLVSGQGTQKIAVHTDGDPAALTEALRTHKRLQAFVIKERERRIT